MGQVVEIARRGNRASSNNLRNVPPGEIDLLGRETCACCFTVFFPKAVTQICTFFVSFMPKAAVQTQSAKSATSRFELRT